MTSPDIPKVQTVETTEPPLESPEKTGVQAPSAPSMTGSILKLAVSRGVVILVTIATAPILGRLFPPHTYGSLGILTTIVSVLAAFASLNYVMAIPLAATPDERRDLYVICVLFGIITTAIMALGAFWGGDLLASAFHEPDVAKYALFLPLLYFATAARNLIDTTLSCQRQFTTVAVRNVLDIVVTRIGQFAGCFVGLVGSPLALILGALIGSFASAVVGGAQSSRRIVREAAKSTSLAGLWQVARKFHKFPTIALWSQTINALTFGLPAMILGMRFSVEVVGLYGMAFAMVTLPLQLFTQSANQVFYVELGERASQGVSSAGPAQQLIRLLSALTSFPLAVVAMLGPLIFALFLGPRWYEAGVYAQILVPWMAVMAFASPLCVAFRVFDRLGESFIWNLAILAARFSTLYFGGMFLDARSTLVLFVAASAIIVGGMLLRSLSMLDVSWRWATAMIVRPYLESAILLIPAGIFYWYFGTTLGALAALVFACAAYGLVLHLRYPRIVKSIVLRLVNPGMQRSSEA